MTVKAVDLHNHTCILPSFYSRWPGYDRYEVAKYITYSHIGLGSRTSCASAVRNHNTALCNNHIYPIKKCGYNGDRTTMYQSTVFF